jgi:hypothetical protein
MKSSMVHLVRRTWLSITDSRSTEADLEVAKEILNVRELELWERMQSVDQRHSVRVFSRFRSLLPDSTREECAAVLLHDVGKSVARLGTLARIGATIGVLRTRRAEQYRDHEAIGVNLAIAQNLDEQVIAAMSGRGRGVFIHAFHLADNE